MLYKRFAQWRQRPKININNEMNKVRNINNIRSEKYDLLDKLETTRAERAIIKSAKRILQKQLLKYLFIS